MNLTFQEAKITLDNGVWLCIKVAEPAPAREFVLTKKNRMYSCEIKEYREKRSLDANKYAWALLSKLADELNTTKEELYLQKVTLTQDEAKTFRVAWEMLGTGWPTEQVDFDKDGDRVVVRSYYGSSTYNTKQMSRLIDSIVEDAKEIGVETLPPDKIQAMKEEWGRA